MVVELKAKSQVTIPASFVSALKLKRGDLFEAVLDGDHIVLIPVVAYPREYVQTLEHELRDRGNVSEPFNDLPSLVRALDSD